MKGPIYIEYSLNTQKVTKKDRPCDENGIYSSNIIEGYDMLSSTSSGGAGVSKILVGTSFMWWALSTIAAHLRAAIGLRAAFGNFLLHENGGLFTVTFGDKVPTLAFDNNFTSIRNQMLGEFELHHFVIFNNTQEFYYQKCTYRP